MQVATDVQLLHAKIGALHEKLGADILHAAYGVPGGISYRVTITGGDRVRGATLAQAIAWIDEKLAA